MLRALESVSHTHIHTHFSCRCLALSTSSLRLGSVYLPAPPQGSGGEDSIETAGGTRCRQSINSSGGYVDVGVSGSAATPETVDPFLQYRPFSNERDARALVYARVTIPLGQRPERIDCTRLYEMELQRLREEIALLRMAAE